MIRKINFKNTTAARPASDEEPRLQKAPRHSNRVFKATVEYGLLSGLVEQQYQQGNNVLWDRLLALPFEERIPSLITRYGKKTAQRLLVTALSEFVASLQLPAYKRPTETGVRVAACEIMLSAHEDYLAIEDIILFLQRARAGSYGPIKSLVNMQLLLALLDRYRQERHTAYMKLKDQKEASFKQMGPAERSAPQPTLLGDLFSQAMIVDMNKKMSG